MTDNHQPRPFGLPEWLTVADLAELLGWSEKRVWNARFRRNLPDGHRIPGIGLRFKRADIDAWLATGNTRAA